MPVGDMGVQAQLLAFPQIGVAVIVGVGSEDLSGKVLLTMAQALEILPGSFQHGWSMGIILTIAEGLPVDNHLVLGIDQSLAVIALDHPMGRLHLGRVVIRDVTADLLARGAMPGLRFSLSHFSRLPIIVCLEFSHVPFLYQGFDLHLIPL
jgi:hypothetical protein